MRPRPLLSPMNRTLDHRNPMLLLEARETLMGLFRPILKNSR